MYKILVVDDDRGVLRVLEEFLGRMGYEVMTALGGEKAIRIIESGLLIGLMVVDLKMPRVDGIAVLKRMKERKHDIPVIVLSGSIKLGGYLNALKELGYGYGDILYKPIDLYALSDMIGKRLPRKDQRRPDGEKDISGR